MFFIFKYIVLITLLPFLHRSTTQPLTNDKSGDTT